MTMNVKVKILHPDAVMPSYEHQEDAGFDLYSVEDVLVYPGCTAFIPTGLAFEIPRGYELQIRMRSGASLDTPLIVANAPGTVDAGFRGEVAIIMRNISSTGFTVRKGSRLAQGVISPVAQATFIRSDRLDPSSRGSGAFGSTGGD